MISLVLTGLMLWWIRRTVRAYRFRCGLFCDFHVEPGHLPHPALADAVLDMHRRLSHPPLL